MKSTRNPPAQKRNASRKRLVALAPLLVLSAGTGFSYFVVYKEQFYRLFHVHYQQYPDDVIENIYWLEKAVKADFCNPRHALAKITDEDDWEKYRYLFMMHVNLKLIEQHMRLAATFDKEVAYFYEAPWKKQYLRDLEKAEQCFQTGLVYWQEARLWAEKASTGNFQFLFLPDIQNWEDERYRIASGDLDYGKILNRELARLGRVRDTFLAMDGETY